jgi:membrane protein DedA with SNARE-associated domain
MTAFEFVRAAAVVLNLVAVAAWVWFYWLLAWELAEAPRADTFSYENLWLVIASFAPIISLVALLWRRPQR